ncbi:uncharacterized protein LOC108090679 [Drosophila ficusphila]|uniref:uncharacterized protein LOC108090679 n=1 Tax=Drosophila ficusphila TaxID=30025 RepID=UPI001C8962F5|nr:uncharacterized protein LOC108090679 [Drosophila ficusphila]
MERFGVPRGKRPRVQVSMDDKEKAIARIRGGETKAGISRELGVPESTVRGWVKRAEQRMARDAAGQSGTNNYSSILAMALTKPQVTISTKASLSSVNSKLCPSSPPLALKSLKLPQKRDINGHSVQNPAMAPVSIPVPIPVPFPVPPTISTDSQQQIIAWLHIFNAGLLNFTLIATAAVLQARSRGLADRLPLWQIITDYVDEAGRTAAGIGGQYLKAAPSTLVSSKTQLMGPTSPRHRMMHGRPFRGKLKNPPVHITAEDDEDGSTDAESEQ